MDLHGILIVDKPRGLTSHDVVNRIRHLLDTRKVGHGGTLDPAAEGVLVIAIGRATKLLDRLSTSTKRYAAHIVLGVGSVTGDIDGPAEDSVRARQPPGDDEVRQTLKKFIGVIDQQPPAYSAIKLGGQPIYQRARRGETIDIPRRQVTIRTLTLLEYRYPDLFLDVECSAGTYVRSLARDIGESLGTSGYLHYLLRTSAGHFDLANAWSLPELERRLSPESFPLFAHHPATATEEAGATLLDSDEIQAWYDGRPLTARSRDEFPSVVHAFRIDGTWLGVGTSDPDRKIYRPRIVVHE